jgi:hypothetical protein
MIWFGLATVACTPKDDSENCNAQNFVDTLATKRGNSPTEIQSRVPSRTNSIPQDLYISFFSLTCPFGPLVLDEVHE